MSELGQELDFAAVRKRTAGCVRAKVTCGPYLPFDRTMDLAGATAQSGRWFGLQQFQASEGRRVPKVDLPNCSRLFVLRPLGMANWKIRRAEPRDATELADCIDAAYSIYASRIWDLPAVSEGIAEDIENNVVWIAEQDDKLVGGMVLVLKKNHVVLANVAVDPIAAGTGLGRAFTELAETESRRLGRVKLRLSTHVNMPENVSLYEHLGWQEAGRSGNKVHMEKTLDLSGGY